MRSRTIHNEWLIGADFGMAKSKANFSSNMSSSCRCRHWRAYSVVISGFLFLKRWFKEPKNRNPLAASLMQFDAVVPKIGSQTIGNRAYIKNSYTRNQSIELWFLTTSQNCIVFPLTFLEQAENYSFICVCFCTIFTFFSVVHIFASAW